MPRYFTKLVNQKIDEYNQELKKAKESSQQHNSNYTENFLQERYKNETAALEKKISEQLVNLAGEIKKRSTEIMQKRIKALYPLYNSDQKTASELQRAEAQEILKRNDESEILLSIKRGMELGRTDFVSTIFDGIKFPAENIFQPNEFYTNLSKLRNIQYKELKVPDTDQEELTDVKNAISKAGWVFRGIKDHAPYINLVDPDTKELSDQLFIASENRKFNEMNPRELRDPFVLEL